MNKDCSIVQDLLPLYAEDMLREETKEFVDGHLAQCEACRAELAALKADVTPAPVNAQPLRDLKRQLRRRKLTAVLLAVALAIMSDGLTDLSGIESISVNLLTPVSGTKVTSTQDPDSGKTVYFITAWRTPLDTWRGAFDESGAGHTVEQVQRGADALQGALGKVESARTLFTLDTANCAAVYYSSNNGQDDVLLCGSRDGGIISLPRLALGYYVLLSLALLIPLSIAFFLCRRKKAGKALGHLALIPACYLVGHLLVKGFVTTSYQMQRDFSLIVLTGALLYAAALLAGDLLRRRRDAAE